jgi:hypothetical protein
MSTSFRPAWLTQTPWQDPDLWTCPVNPHLMYIWCNIYLFIYHSDSDSESVRQRGPPVRPIVWPVGVLPPPWLVPTLSVSTLLKRLVRKSLDYDRLPYRYHQKSQVTSLPDSHSVTSLLHCESCDSYQFLITAAALGGISLGISGEIVLRYTFIMWCCIFLGYILLHGVYVYGAVYWGTFISALVVLPSIEMFMCDTGVLPFISCWMPTALNVQSESAGPCTKVGSNMLHVIDDGL